MALGIFASKGDAQRNSDSSDGNVAKPDKTYDPESGLSEKNYRGDIDSDSSNSITVGKQIEMEAENAIKYRTCSWQKVCCPYGCDRSGCQFCMFKTDTTLRPLPCYSLNIYAWPSCRFRGPTRSSALCLG
jgi:hypothetical protein